MAPKPGRFIALSNPKAAANLISSAIKEANESWKQSTNLRSFAEKLQQNFEKYNGVGWNIIVGKDISLDIRIRKGACVILQSESSGFKVLIFRSSAATNVPIMPSSSSQKKIQLKLTKDPIVVESDMEEETKQFALSSCVNAFSTYSDSDDIAKFLKFVMTKKLGATWHIIVSTSHELSCFPYSNMGSYLDVKIGKSRVIMFQYNGHTLDSRCDLLRLAHRATFVLSFIIMLVYWMLHIRCPEDCSTSTFQNSNPDHPLTLNCTDDVLELAARCSQVKTFMFIGVCLLMGFGGIARLYRSSLLAKRSHT